MDVSRPARHDVQKKTAQAAEQQRPDVQAARQEWFEPGFDWRKLIFVDETAAATNLARPRLIEDGPCYLCFAGASLWILRQRTKMLIDACETRYLSEARMRLPKAWTLLTSEIRPWDTNNCRLPEEHMELVCSGRNRLWLTVTSKAGDVGLHTAAFSLDDLIETIAL